MRLRRKHRESDRDADCHGLTQEESLLGGLRAKKLIVCMRHGKIDDLCRTNMSVQNRQWVLTPKRTEQNATGCPRAASSRTIGSSSGPSSTDAPDAIAITTRLNGEALDELLINHACLAPSEAAIFVKDGNK